MSRMGDVGGLEASSTAMREALDSPHVPIHNKFKSTIPAEPPSYSTPLNYEATQSPSTKRTMASMNILPNELLSQIFAYLDGPQPSASVLLDEPSFECTNSEAAHLKACSRVSKRWQQVTKPLLFRHARLIVKEPDYPKPVLEKIIQPFFDFVQKHSLHNIVSTYTLIIHTHEFGHATAGKYWMDSFSTVWKSLFEVIDPLELLIVAPVETLGELAACYVYLPDIWMFNAQCHYLQLKRDAKVIKSLTRSTNVEMDEHQSPAEAVSNQSLNPAGLPDLDAQQTFPEVAPYDEPSASERDGWRIPHSKSSALMDVRPWKSLLLNEGSSIRAYASYEWWLRQPPSIMPDIVGSMMHRQKPLIAPTIRDFNYIGVFPMSHQFRNLVANLPRIDRLYVQLVPRNDTLQDPLMMAQVETEDLWMERNSSYALLMKELFNAPPLNNYKHLQVFESGDAADAEAWRMAVEYVKRAGNGWHVAGEGVLERNTDDLVPESAGIDGTEATSFQGALIRWAFKGTTKLPVSAYSLYDAPLGPV